MKLSRNWLSKYIDLSEITDKEIFHRLTMTTAEFEEFSITGEHFEKIFIGRVLEIKTHPNTQKLKLTLVRIGRSRYRIVCGADNVKAGQMVAVALAGTILPSNQKIQKTEIRGELSEGMICSKADIGLEERSQGIWVLNDKVIEGKTLTEAFSFSRDTIFEIDNKSITHRPDLWNHIGFARELSAIFNKDISLPNPPKIAPDPEPEIKLKIEDGYGCRRYTGLIIENFKVQDSPAWLSQNLEAVGVRSINNIVDITNFIMLEMGEPMHAFDKQKLSGDTIYIRFAKENETLITLDSTARGLSSADLIIADSSGPIALAGVMGGESTEVRKNTTCLFLEAANFNPASIRKTATRLDLRTDASLRFEKSLDPEMTVSAIERAWQLIQELCPGVRCRNLVDQYPTQVNKKTIQLSHKFLEKRLGIGLQKKELVEILNRLTLFTTEKSGTYTVKIPSYRATRDISIPEDIVEEIGRVIGYDQITPVAPIMPASPPLELKFRTFEHLIRDIMTGSLHADELFLYSFYGQKLLQLMNLPLERELKLQNWLSDEMDRLRIDLLPGMVKAASLNLRHFNRFRIFEIGRVYSPCEEYNRGKRIKPNLLKALPLAKEETYLAFLGCEADEINVPFYLGSEALRDLLESLGFRKIKIQRKNQNGKEHDFMPYYHPGRCANIIVRENGQDIRVGDIGELNPQVMANFAIKKRMVLFQINLTIIYSLYTKIENSFIEPHKFPPALFEITVLDQDKEEVAKIITALEKANIDFLQKIELLSIFRGETIPPGMKSVSLGLTFQKKDATISANEIKKLRDLTINILEKSGYPLKS